MNNPFQEISDQLRRLQDSVDELKQAAAQQAPVPLSAEPIGVAEAALLLRYSKQTVYDKVNDGTLPFVKRGNRIYFFREELIAWMRAGVQATAAQLEQQAAQTLDTHRSGRSRKRPEASSS